MSILDIIMLSTDYSCLDTGLKYLPDRDKAEIMDRNILILQKLDTEIKELQLKKNVITEVLRKKKLEKNKVNKIIQRCQDKSSYVCTIS